MPDDPYNTPGDDPTGGGTQGAGAPQVLRDVIESLEDVAEPLRAFYKEGGGKWYLQTEGAAKLKDSLSASREEARAFKAKSSTLEAKIAEIERELQARDRKIEELQATGGKVKDLEAEVEKRIRDQLAQVKENYEAKLAERDGQLKDFRSKHENTFIERALLQAMSEARVDAPEGLMPLLRQRVKIVESGDKYELRVLDAQGREAISHLGANIEPMTVKELLESEYEPHPVYGRFFSSSGSKGSSTPPSGAGAGAGAPAVHGVRSKADLKGVDAQGKFVKEYGEAAFLRLPDAPTQQNGGAMSTVRR